MMTQIKKKWVHKKGAIWINEQDKEVNVENYINRLVEQGYEKYYDKFESSQRRLQKGRSTLEGKR